MARQANRAGDGRARHSLGLLPPRRRRAKAAAARTQSAHRAAAGYGRGQEKGAAMSSSAERFDERARRKADRVGETIVHRGELLRHPVYTRVLHWLVAICFVLSLLSGFAIYAPWLFRWL